MIRIPLQVLEQVRAHASQAYPEECCGALVGSATDTGRAVVSALPAKNVRDAERERRYRIGPDQVHAFERQAADAGLEVIGFYHSHPDHPAEPSSYDVEHAWPWYTYVIVPATRDSAGVPRAWRLRDDRAGFEEQSIAGDET